MEDRIRVSISEGVADVRLVRADKMNALDGAMFAAIVEAGSIPLQMRADPLVPGIREWLEGLAPPPGCRGVAFDTRVDGPTILTGRAVHEIDKGLARAGALIVAAPESFLVNLDSSLVPGEGDRAEAWGLTLGAALTALEV